MPGKAQEGGLAQVVAADFAEEVFGHLLEEGQDVLLTHEAHFAVDLCELGLSVGTQVLVAEALDDLEIAVHAGHHQELLEGLRALRQGIELSLVHAGGYDEVARSLGGGSHENGGLDFQEAFAVEEVAHSQTEPVAQLEVGTHIGAAQVEVAVFHAQVVAAVGMFLNGEGRHFGGIEDKELRDEDFDVAGGQFAVFGEALGHGAGHLDDIFASQSVGLFAERCVGFLVEYELRDAIAVAQVDKRHAAHFAAALHPSGQGDLPAYVLDAQFAAGVCPIHIVWF